MLFSSAPTHHLVFQLVERNLGFEFTADLELHTIELPKFKLAADELGGPLDRWLYFLRHAPELDTSAVPHRLVAPPIQRAVEELTMVTQSEMEHARYETQRKAQMDAVWQANELSRLKEWEKRAGEMEQQLEERNRELARLNQEFEIQRERAELTGKVMAVRDLLGLVEPTDQALAAASQNELKSMLTDLQTRARKT